MQIREAVNTTRSYSCMRHSVLLVCGLHWPLQLAGHTSRGAPEPSHSLH